jgi:hypothetical protein
MPGDRHLPERSAWNWDPNQFGHVGVPGSAPLEELKARYKLKLLGE